MNLRLMLVAAAASAAALAVEAARPHVDRTLHRRLREDGKANIVVTMRERPEAATESMEALTFDSRAAKIAHMVTTLENLAATSQQGIDAVLAHEAAIAPDQPLFESQYTSWTTNARYFSGATFALVEALAQVPDIAEIREEEIYSIDEPTADATELERASSGIEWGVDRVEAPAVWASGVTGEGVVIANIDTGVRASHEALQASMRSDYNWFDPLNKTDVAFDSNGHGTHTMGTIVGANGVGVAPGSKWIACRGCPDGGCPEATLIACGEWITCPTDTQGNNRDCTKAPHVVNNSWSGRAGKTYFIPVIQAWRAAGIVPVFANGNTGPLCWATKFPAELVEVIAVGATTVNNTLASFSSKGPTTFNSTIIKPDISGPGVAVVSTGNTSDTSYVALSGTSMATPHVAGVIALLLSAAPQLAFDQLRTLVTSTAERDSLGPNKLAEPIGWYTGNCGNTSDTDWPNNQYGHGLVNALRAYTAIPSVSTPSPAL